MPEPDSQTAAPALALLEFHSIAAGIHAADAMVKRAPVDQIVAGTVQPGRYLVMVTGPVAEVEEAVNAGREDGGGALSELVYLPQVHPDVVRGIAGGRRPQSGEALGIVETRTAPSAIRAADGGVKGAAVALIQLRFADGLGGKGLAFFAGVLADVEAAVEIGVRLAGDALVRQTIIPQMHAEMWPNVLSTGRFGEQMHWEQS